MSTIEWYGASGRNYIFHVYELPRIFPGGHVATYIYCRWSADRWEPILVGHGDVSECTGGRHPETERLLSHGATHVHLRITPDGSRCESVSLDLQEALSDRRDAETRAWRGGETNPKQERGIG